MTVASTERLALLEHAAVELSNTRKELDLLGWTVLDHFSGTSQDVTADTRRSWARKSRFAWMNDPMAGAAVDLLNDFVFGRGVPKPIAKDEGVQEVIDEFWDDPDNQRVLTSYDAQIALGTDLTLQSNVFLLLFDEGEDGKIKLGVLNHDEVEQAVPDPSFRQRVLWYMAKHRRVEWDFVNDRVKLDVNNAVKTETRYYRHWQLDVEEEGERDLPKPPQSKVGEGKVYHVRVNRTSEMVFGVPVMQRTLRWMSAYNEFMSSRVNMVKAAAAFFMKRKVRGTPNQLTKLATRALSRTGDLATGLPDGVQAPPRSGSILNENEDVTHESFKIDSGAAQAAQDALMLRAQVSAATRFPQHYLGDAGSANLATATAMELPVLKAVESRQEVWEQVFRWAVDRVVERAVDTGRLATDLSPNELQEARRLLREAPEKYAWTVNADGKLSLGRVSRYYDKTRRQYRLKLIVPDVIHEAHEDAGVDEVETQRDLSYEFAMPNPLRRQAPDVVNSAATVARTFDPNNTNMELSRILLGIVLGEAFEVNDPNEMVDRIFPEGYVDPAVAAAQQAAGIIPGGGGQPPSPGSGESEGAKALGGDTTYGAKGGAVPAEEQPIREAATIARDGQTLVRWTPTLDHGERELVTSGVNGRLSQLEQEYRDSVTGPALDALTRVERDLNGGSK